MNTEQPLALRLADELKNRFGSTVPTSQAAAELRRLHDLLGKANALARIRAERNEELWKENFDLRARNERLEKDGQVVVTWNFDRTKILSVTRQDDEHRILKVIADAQSDHLTQEQDDLLDTLNELTAQRDQLRKALDAMVRCSKTMNMVQCAEASQAAEAALRAVPAAIAKAGEQT